MEPRITDLTSVARAMAIARVGQGWICVVSFLIGLGFVAEALKGPPALALTAIVFLCIAWTLAQGLSVLEGRLCRRSALALTVFFVSCLFVVADSWSDSPVFVSSSVIAPDDRQTVAVVLGFWSLLALLVAGARLAVMRGAAQSALRRLQVAPGYGKLPRIDTRRGALLLCGAVLVLLALPIFHSVWNGEQPFGLVAMGSVVLIKVLCLRAQRWLQPNPYAILATDTRPPVLFLRSFADDAAFSPRRSPQALFDVSLESRLANHFSRFGPFIAVATPNETVPQIGAARIKLEGQVWQYQVQRWMEQAQTVVMFCGTTPWVNWELRTLQTVARVDRLILVWPEGSHPIGEAMARLTAVREAFAGSPWAYALRHLPDASTLRAIRFEPAGKIRTYTSHRPGRDAYHLAALLAQ